MRRCGPLLAYVTRAVIVGAVVLSSASAHADRRSFTHTYEYTTVPEGKTSLELWNTQTRSTTAASSPQQWQGILELEHGLTEHWDFSFYTVLEQLAGGGGVLSEPFHLAELKLETRYRLSERGERPVDTVLYLDAAKQFGGSTYRFEGRVIGARDFGDVTLAANAIAVLVTGHDVPETKVPFGGALGASYQTHPKLRVGVEVWALYQDEHVLMDAGPVLSFAPTPTFWATLTAGFALTERDAVAGPDHGAYSGRVIFGLYL